MLDEQDKLESLALLGVELNQVHDLDILMEQVLTKARLFTNADAGSIYIRHGEYLHFSYTQNDTLEKRLADGEKLIYSNFKIPVDDSSIAGYVALTGQPLNIPNVYKIEPHQPYRFFRQMDEKSDYVTRSVLALPLKTARGDILGILQSINALDPEGNAIEFSWEDQQMMTHFASIASVALERAKMTRALFLRMIRMAEMRDPKETAAHVNRVAGYAVEIYEAWARKRGIAKNEIDVKRDILRMAAMLHDVGKVAISDIILKKPSRLNIDEFEIMKQHTILGARLFAGRESDFDEAAHQVALTHHERWDGQGYPGHVDYQTGTPLPGYALPGGRARGKRAEEIPLFGRIVALADVYDALSSERVYKEAWRESKILRTIHDGAGTQFDPELVDIFFSRLDVIRSIQSRYEEEPDLAFDFESDPVHLAKIVQEGKPYWEL